MRITNCEELVRKMQENPVVINNHTNEETALTGLVEFVNPDKGLACCCDAVYYSLNLCYIDDKDGKLHCSQMSIGGVLKGAQPDSRQLKEYNESVISDGGKIKCIHLPDGNKVYPA